MEETIMIQVRFKEKVKVKGMTLEYSDAIYYTEEQYAKLDKEAHEATKQARVDNWKSTIENPPEVKEPTKEDMEAEIAALEEQKASLEARKTELADKITALSAVPNEEPIEEKQ